MCQGLLCQVQPEAQPRPDLGHTVVSLHEYSTQCDKVNKTQSLSTHKYPYEY